MSEQNNWLQFIDKGSNRKTWSINTIEGIKIGAEGQKETAELVLSKRSVNGIFLKQANGLIDAREQHRKWQILHSSGIPTTSFFRIAKDPDSQIWMVMEDLSNNGNNWVVSANNNELLMSRYYWEQVVRIPSIKIKLLSEQAKQIATIAGENGISFYNSNKRMNPLMITVSRDPSQEVDVAIYAQDFGIDMDLVFPSADLQLSNKAYALGFLHEVLKMCPYRDLSLKLPRF